MNGGFAIDMLSRALGKPETVGSGSTRGSGKKGSKWRASAAALREAVANRALGRKRFVDYHSVYLAYVLLLSIN